MAEQKKQFLEVIIPKATRALGYPVLTAAYDAQDSGAEEYAQAYRLQIIAVDALASHEFHDSVKVRTSYDGGAGRDVWHRIREAYSDVVQAKIMEDGRRAGATPPPVDAILRWMPLKGMEPDRNHAYAIAMAIHKRGIRPRHPARRAYQVASPTVFAFFEAAMDKTVAEINRR